MTSRIAIGWHFRLCPAGYQQDGDSLDEVLDDFVGSASRADYDGSAQRRDGYFPSSVHQRLEYGSAGAARVWIGYRPDLRDK